MNHIPKDRINIGTFKEQVKSVPQDLILAVTNINENSILGLLEIWPPVSRLYARPILSFSYR